ncbi:MAG TPA: capsular biosynthesis protein, partial [Cyanobacteria bacterium UBA11049]|nr:capsular biosynthesis protein [Cyanobacteria bacterium UBA11049]
MLSCAAMILGSGSRLGLICLIVLPIAHFVLINIARPTFQITAGVASFFLGAFGFQLLNALLDLKEQITAQRSESSRVREVLGRMALYRWQDAPVWGHGLVATDGPKVSENMPIGSHHTWFGLLYT